MTRQSRTSYPAFLFDCAEKHKVVRTFGPAIANVTTGVYSVRRSTPADPSVSFSVAKSAISSTLLAAVSPDTLETDGGALAWAVDHIDAGNSAA